MSMSDGAQSIIQKLPEHLANQIAAGEVVQRPESVVKELVENAIDAGADHVTVIVAQAGKTLIQVMDNGRGMSDEDALAAFERHATSKIQKYEDLENVLTFGFRGEALPSIASVAKVELKTKTRDEELATVVRFEGGRLVDHSRDQSEQGTTVIVRNLFYNTPARRQFLKADTTEYRHIADTIVRFVLSYPNVRITFISGDETIYDALPADLRGRIAYVFGEPVADSLIEVDESTDVISISGFVGRPNFAKKTRGDQFLFVNGRYIISRLLNHAVVSCYEHMLDQGEYPFYVLFLNINPREVDVNVHPSKLEVKFSNERNVYTILNAVVRRHLFQHDLTPSIQFRNPADAEDAFSRMKLVPPEESTDPSRAKYESFESLRRGFNVDRPLPGQRLDPQQVDDLFRSMGLDSTASSGSPDETVLLPSEKPISDTQFLWQLHNKYIFTPIKSGLMIIDQHIAHERILYEKALEALDHAAPFSQQLLFPHLAQLSASDYALVKEVADELRKVGFVLSLQNNNRVMIEAVPQDVRIGMEETILEELVEQYKEYSQAGTTDVRHNIAASYACRASIKSGDKLSPPEMQTLIDRLFATSNPYVCPHGRPVVIRLSLAELDHRFGRTS